LSGEAKLPIRKFHKRKDIPTMKVGLEEQNCLLGSSTKGKIFPRLKLVWKRKNSFFGYYPDLEGGSHDGISRWVFPKRKI